MMKRITQLRWWLNPLWLFPKGSIYLAKINLFLTTWVELAKLENFNYFFKTLEKSTWMHMKCLVNPKHPRLSCCFQWQTRWYFDRLDFKRSHLPLSANGVSHHPVLVCSTDHHLLVIHSTFSSAPHSIFQMVLARFPF